jgi:hypothetical protein
MTGDQLFKEHLEKEQKGTSGLLKRPKTWAIPITVLAAIILGVVIYKSITSGMTGKEVIDSIAIAWHDTTWMDKEVTPQEVKIVPALRLKIKNVGQRPLKHMDIEVVFHLKETGDRFSDGMTRILSKEPLLPGETSEEILIKSLYGYTAKSRASFFQNKEAWKKMEARVFARASGSPLVSIGEKYPIKQVIEGYNQNLPSTDEMPSEYSDEPTRQVAQSIRIVEQDSLWVDKLVTAKNVIIVPSMTIEIRNVGQSPLHELYFKGIFKYEDTGEVLSEGLTPALKDPLSPGETSQPIKIYADFGYAASSKEAFFKGSQQRWRYLKVNLYAKSQESNWALLGIFPIKAKIQGVKVVYQ